MGTAATTIAILGAGTMGEALLTGSLDGGLAAHDVWVTARSARRVDDLVATYGVHGTTDNARAASGAGIVVLAVPPQNVTDLVAEVADHLGDGAVVVSLADGISLADLEGLLPRGAAAARAMPSLTSRVGHGLTLLTTGDGCTEEQAEAITAFLGRSGEVVRVEEDRQAALGPLSSGGPAYFLYVADAMIEAGAVRGVPRDLARRLVARAMAGSAAWLQDSAEDAAALRAQVTAPGGAGIRRIAELDRRAVRAAFVTALTRSV
ncbi:MAG: pyrroline-5-carboxylate reductase family protein [Thermoleophilia bacterium]